MRRKRLESRTESWFVFVHPISRFFCVFCSLSFYYNYSGLLCIICCNSEWKFGKNNGFFFSSKCVPDPCPQDARRNATVKSSFFFFFIFLVFAKISAVAHSQFDWFSASHFRLSCCKFDCEKLVKENQEIEKEERKRNREEETDQIESNMNVEGLKKYE